MKKVRFLIFFFYLGSSIKCLINQKHIKPFPWHALLVQAFQHGPSLVHLELREINVVGSWETKLSERRHQQLKIQGDPSQKRPSRVEQPQKSSSPPNVAPTHSQWLFLPTINEDLRPQEFAQSAHFKR